MDTGAGVLDGVTRELIRQVGPDLRRWLAVPRVDVDLVAALYLRTRGVLERWVALPEDVLAHDQPLQDQLALELYLTAAAWQTADKPDPSLLVEIRKGICTVFEACGRSEASRYDRSPLDVWGGP